MTILTWAASALSVAVLSWQAALPAPRLAGPPSARMTETTYEAAYERVEREVTSRLRQPSDRVRFSRVHRPTPRYRTEPDAARTDRHHIGLRVMIATRPAGTERVVWLVRVARADGTIELAAAHAPEAATAPAWRPLHEALPPDPDRLR